MPAQIIDVHTRSSDGIAVTDIPKQIADGLLRPFGQKQLPTVLLYDERGLRLYDDITTRVPEYYLFGAEEEILKSKADEIVQAMHRGASPSADEVILELGAGALRKTSHILLGISKFVKKEIPSASVTYYALDLEKSELERTLSQISISEIGQSLDGTVNTKGMWGTYYDGLKFIQDGGLVNQKVAANLSAVDSIRTISRQTSSDTSDSDSDLPVTPRDTIPPLHIMFLGSTLGNFDRQGASSFLRSLPLRAGSGDTLLIGLDHDNDKAVIEEAYNDSRGYTKRFIFNGLRAADGPSEMRICRHEAFFQSKCGQTIVEPGSGKLVKFTEGELLKIEQSYKFSETDSFMLFTDSNLRPIQRWMDEESRYSLWLLERPLFSFPLLRSPTSPLNKNLGEYSLSPFGVPSRVEWNDMWVCWDFITRQMIPPSMLFQKPIDLRHICLFYLGHIPTFLDIHLSKLFQEPHTEPEAFKRGIDPNVDDPTECHPHSEVPVKDEDWPALPAIMDFQTAVRARLMRLYDDIDSGKLVLSRKIGRVLFMTFEHEAMHAETLLYMLLQRAGTGTIPPPGFVAPPWASLAAGWAKVPPPSTKTVTMGPATVTLGHRDLEEGDSSDDILTHEFGWDNEHPKREVHVQEFKIEWRPVTNGEFYEYYMGAGKGRVDFPASWMEDDDGIKVRTLYGPIPIDTAYHWPIITSYNNLSTYATVKGGRLPSEPELRLFYDKFEAGYEGGANVGFRNWHPVPATTGGERNNGKGTNGGIWEWTSTEFDKFDGFVTSKLYPGYSTDFFDGKHHVVLGGSSVTPPRISERRSFRNWYQKNYPYAWAGGRIVYDTPGK
ncbi:DUF323 domain-containing protein [Gymnopilus junonius]|uniref:DUF323 domain-containing protein n=1 Tax=Gymnopilus junonius TaxID=109634 RepID=A0A9P5NYG3_GYMJU|nr:DUF323 domain-containing protein [Gymnopilus junonius]